MPRRSLAKVRNRNGRQLQRGRVHLWPRGHHERRKSGKPSPDVIGERRVNRRRELDARSGEQRKRKRQRRQPRNRAAESGQKICLGIGGMGSGSLPELHQLADPVFQHGFGQVGGRRRGRCCRRRCRRCRGRFEVRRG